MMKSKKYGMMLAVLAAAGGVSASAAPLPVYELKGLTVTATRQAETTQDVPANVQIVTEKEIKARNVQNAAQPSLWRPVYRWILRWKAA